MQQLPVQNDRIKRTCRLEQVEAAALFGIREPNAPKLLRGDLRQFSVERLLRFLVALDQDLESVVNPHLDRSNAPMP